MNKKKIAGALGALICMVSFSSFALSEAEAGGSSAMARERAAEEERKTGINGPWVQGQSYEAKIITPILISLQNRIAQYNNLKIKEELFRQKNEYKDTLHPVVVVDGLTNSYSTGSGHIYIGVEEMEREAESQNINILTHFDYMSMEKTIAHEAGHNLNGHGYSYTSLFVREKSEKRVEQEAEDMALKLIGNLPEGGWGIYTMEANRLANRPEQNAKNIRMMEEQTNGRVSLNSGKKKYNGIVDQPTIACDESAYIGTNGKSYNIVAGIDTKDWDFFYKVDGTYHDDNAYLAGQIAECIAKDAFKPENIFVIQNHLKDAIKFDGDYLLVCKSANLPNGYRVLASLYGPEERLTNMISILHDNQFNRSLDDIYNVCVKNMKISGKKSIHRSEWLIAEIGAMAIDNTSH